MKGSAFPRIVWGSPLPPTRSGIADYAAALLPYLARSAAIDLLEPPGWRAPDDAPWLANLPRRPWDSDAPPGSITLLHLGNNPYHLWIARRLRRSGGIIVLHDTILHHLLVEEAAEDGDWGRFGAELAQAHGAAGTALAAARVWGYAGRLDPFLFPARSVYLRHAKGVIVHTRTAEREVATSCEGTRVRRVPLAVAPPQQGDRAAWRARLGARKNDFLLVHLGFLTPAKGLDVVIGALAVLKRLGLAVRLVTVGEGSEAEAFDATVAAADLRDSVVAWGYASASDLGGILAAADLGLVPRYPTAGETSAAALRFFAAGKPVAVAGYRQFLEFPQEGALRIAPGKAGIAGLVRVVAHLSGSAKAREVAGSAARAAWVAGGHDPASAGDALLEALGELASDVA